MSESLVLQRSFGDVEVWAEDDGGLSFDWYQPTDDARAYPIRLELTADEFAQIVALREKVKAAKDHTHSPRVRCHPACQTYSPIEALKESLREGHDELTQDYPGGGDEERIEHMDSWLDSHGLIVESLRGGTA
jgi:hypothetical protein